MPSSNPPPNPPNSALWGDLAARFSQGGELRGHYTQMVPGEWHSWLDGQSADVEDFKSLAALAAVALGYPSGPEAWLSWMETLRTRSPHFRDHAEFSHVEDRASLETLRTRSPYLGDKQIRAEGRIGTIEKLRAASASFCRVLQTERQAAELTQLSESPPHQAVQSPQAAIESPEVAPLPPLNTAAERRKAVEQFLDRANVIFEGPGELTKRHFWLAAGYQTRRQFQAWQAGGTSKRPDKRFRNVLVLSPEDFIRKLKAKQKI
jgi:hypothetical protein